MTKEGLTRLIKRIYEVDGSEEEITELVFFLRKQFPNAKMIDLIFHDPRELTPEQILDEAIEREAAYARQAKQG